jgi:hypothetical protein
VFIKALVIDGLESVAGCGDGTMHVNSMLGDFIGFEARR